MRRSDQPSRPSAMTCCFFSSLKTLLMPTERNPPRQSMSRTLLSLAGFQVITSGRFWVIAEEHAAPERGVGCLVHFGQLFFKLA